MAMSSPSVEGERSASERVIDAVADREGVEPTALDVPLFAAIDPERLDELVRSAADGGGGSKLRVEFTYLGYDIEVTSDRGVNVTRRG